MEKRVVERLDLDNNLVITADNVMRISENIATKALKTLMCHYPVLESMYKGLLLDIYNQYDEGHTFSDGYDIAQSIALFLCDYIGKKLGEHFCFDSKGKEVTLKHKCYKVANQEIYYYHRTPLLTVSINELEPYIESTLQEIVETEKDDETYQKIDSLKLNQDQLNVLNGLMAGHSYRAVAKMLEIAMSTCYKRKTIIRRKYIQMFGGAI